MSEEPIVDNTERVSTGNVQSIASELLRLAQRIIWFYRKEVYRGGTYTYNPEIVEHKSRSEAELFGFVQQSPTNNIHVDLATGFGQSYGISSCIRPVCTVEDVAFLHGTDWLISADLTEDEIPDFMSDLNGKLKQAAILSSDGIGPCKRL